MSEPSEAVGAITIVGDHVVIVWGDGHESYYPGEELRRACTCAGCQGEQLLFGQRTLPTVRPSGKGAFVPVAVHLVGNYGVKVVWGDGHDHGIFHLSTLRAICPCEHCAATRNAE